MSTSPAATLPVRRRCVRCGMERMSLADIAQQFGCSRQYVLTLCRAYGIPRRTKSQARLEALQKGKRPGYSPQPVPGDQSPG